MTLQTILKDIEPFQDKLSSHPVFSSLQTPDDLRLFMQWHVFAVWDFMSLLKRLQFELTSTALPWMPDKSTSAARLINEIVLAEETDEAPDGGHMSHFELYLAAMDEIGADRSSIDRLIDDLNTGSSIDRALRSAKIDQPVQDFTLHTLRVAQHGSIFEVLGYFFFGREQVIPHMFSALLRKWHIDTGTAPTFVYYLDRHIELDGDSHGPAALAIIEEMTTGNSHALKQIQQAAHEATQHRLNLWDGLATKLARQQPASTTAFG